MIFKDIYTRTVGSSPVKLANIGVTLYFNADDGVHGEEYPQSNGTASGTMIVKDIHLGTNGDKSGV